MRFAWLKYFTYHPVPVLAPNYKQHILSPAKVRNASEISGSHGGEYELYSLMGCSAVFCRVSLGEVERVLVGVSSAVNWV
jgi:hypothetical protein